jgi:hypothetical protein
VHTDLAIDDGTRESTQSWWRDVLLKLKAREDRPQHRILAVAQEFSSSSKLVIANIFMYE